MFAVKGWNVPTGQLQVQNARDKPKKSQDGILDPSSAKKQGDGSNKSKKRKRNGEKHEGPRPAANDQQRPRSDVTKDSSSRPEKSNKKERKNESKSKTDTTSSPAPAIDAEPPVPPPATSLASIPPPDLPSNVKLTPLQRSMRDKLLSSRFRFLNEQLYTTPSASSLKTFKENPSLYTEYHDGFTRQVASWPENPVELFYAEIVDRAEGARKALGTQKGAFRDIKKGKFKKDAPQVPNIQRGPVKPLPRDRRTGKCTIADLGCGDAKLASRLTAAGEGAKPLSQRFNIAISSYDLSCPDTAKGLITIADIANLPLQSDSVDIAIFCLALMGTNWPDFIDEAYRILHRGGELWIAEVKSRFVSKATLSKTLKSAVVEHSVGKRVKPAANTKAKEEEEDEGLEDVPRRQVTDTAPFIAVLRSRGFILDGEVDDSNKMFVRMKFIKTGPPPSRGKHANADGQEIGVNGFKPKKKPKFLDDDEEVPGRNASVDELAEMGLVKGEEARVLKGCLYKTR